jgi:hypothetical protein
MFTSIIRAFKLAYPAFEQRINIATAKLHTNLKAISSTAPPFSHADVMAMHHRQQQETKSELACLRSMD